jgi:hypothetical protein
MAQAKSPVYKTWIRLLDKETVSGFDSLSAEEKNFYRIYLLEHETYGGGLDVWFHQGEHHNEVATALRNIGADKSARIIEDAMKFVFPQGIAPLDEAARRSYIPEYEDANRAWFGKLDRFDSAYCQDPDNLDHLLITYARKFNFLVE